MRSRLRWKLSEPNDTLMKIRLILDTNLWIRYLIAKDLARIDLLFERDEVVLLFSEELLEELIRVAKRPKFRRYFSEESIEELLRLFDYYGQLVEVSSTVEACRDPKDNFLLALARDGSADYLVTTDLDLLVLEEFEDTRILTFQKFEEGLEAE